MDHTVIQQQCHALKKDIQQATMKSTQCSSWRFILIIVTIAFLYYASNGHTWCYVGACFAVVVFLVIAKRHAKIKTVIEEKETLLEVYQDIEKRKTDAWKQFEDTGVDFLNKEMTQAYDLDLFGTASLFQYLSCAKTVFGREVLASYLQVEKQDKAFSILRQEAVKECLSKEPFSMSFAMVSKLFGVHAKKLKKKKLASFLEFMNTQGKKQPSIITFLSFLLPCIVLVSFGAAFLSFIPINLAMASFTVTLSFAILMFLKNSAELSDVDNMSEVMKDYVHMFEVIQAQSFESALLKQQQLVLQDALGAIKELTLILSFVKVRSNSILFLFANGVFLMDFHCARALYQWKKRYGRLVQDWLKAVGTFEAIISLSQIGFAKNTFCFPSFEDDLTIEMKEIVHPLIMEEKSIANSLVMKQNSYVITGSNMSGKTTFLRTIGVNMVLAMAGAPVCATSFHACSLSIYTSMRVHDDVSEGISTFYAEILRIKQMMDASKQGNKMLVLIDEIFKGTNSADRILCATQAIKRLHLPFVITMVSTHDFELCDLDKDKEVQAINYHFSEYYEEETICFDYQLKEGRCKTTNAKQLMKLAGF